MTFRMKCDSRALTNIILDRGYIVRSCDIKQAISEYLSRDVLWIMVRRAKLKQCCGSELVVMAAEYQDLFILDLLFDIGITFPEHELHNLFRAWNSRFRVQTGLKFKLVEQILKQGYQVTQEDIFFAPTKKDSRHDRLSIKNLLKEKKRILPIHSLK